MDFRIDGLISPWIRSLDSGIYEVGLGTYFYPYGVVYRGGNIYDAKTAFNLLLAKIREVSGKI